MRQSPITCCSACDIPEGDWTPGCRTCTARHYKRATRSADQALMSRYRVEARAHVDAGVQETARRIRDGELVASGSWLGRDGHGRWVRQVTA